MDRCPYLNPWQTFIKTINSCRRIRPRIGSERSCRREYVRKRSDKPIDRGWGEQKGSQSHLSLGGTQDTSVVVGRTPASARQSSRSPVVSKSADESTGSLLQESGPVKSLKDRQFGRQRSGRIDERTTCPWRSSPLPLYRRPAFHPRAAFPCASFDSAITPHTRAVSKKSQQRLPRVP